MITYEYQLLRYLPDRVTGEFLNVGVVLFSRHSSRLLVRTIQTSTRVSCLFPGVKGKRLTTTLRQLATSLRELGELGDDGTGSTAPRTITDFTHRALPPDDSALIWSPPAQARDLDLEEAFEDLFDRTVAQHEVNRKPYRTDEKVWRETYQPYLEKYHVRELLHPHAVNIGGNKIKFDYAVKNGVWNCLEPVTFDLRNPDSVKEKVYRWMGKIQELTGSSEKLHLYLLSELPADKKLRAFVRDRIEEQRRDREIATEARQLEVELITPDQAADFAARLKEDVTH